MGISGRLSGQIILFVIIDYSWRCCQSVPWRLETLYLINIQQDFLASTMSKVPSTSASSTSFETIFAAALKEYKKQTKRDIASHPLATRLQSCDSSTAILAVLRSQVHKFDQSQSIDEKWMNWVDPTVNVLYAFSATLGSGIGLVITRR